MYDVFLTIIIGVLIIRYTYLEYVFKRMIKIVDKHADQIGIIATSMQNIIKAVNATQEQQQQKWNMHKEN